MDLKVIKGYLQKSFYQGTGKIMLTKEQLVQL